jgi:hypothetical protein
VRRPAAEVQREVLKLNREIGDLNRRLAAGRGREMAALQRELERAQRRRDELQNELQTSGEPGAPGPSEEGGRIMPAPADKPRKPRSPKAGPPRE